MTILKDLSVVWTLLHALAVFFMLCESRYSKKRFAIIISSTIVPLVIANFLLFVFIGFENYGTLMLLTLSLPSCLIFWFTAKHRDGRYLFTFCMVDTIVLEILYVTNILNHYLTPNSYIVLFAVRILIFPLMEIWIYKKVRKMYIEVQNVSKLGWGHYAIIGLLLYLTMTILMTHPTPITERPESLLPLILLFILMPVIYINIISTLGHLHKLHEMTEQENILKLQISNITSRMEQLAEADNKFRVERHNFRHKMKTISSLLDSMQYDECRALLDEYCEQIREPQVKRYCQNPVIDAVLSTYIRMAENHNIKVTFGFAFPDVLPMSETELATAIANAMENAVNACEKLQEDKRYIDIKVLSRPRFIIQIANSYEGEISFDENDIPINDHEDHGFGTRFIAAFCNKHNGFYQFKADKNKFTVFMNF